MFCKFTIIFHFFDASRLFSTAAISIYIPTNSSRGIPFTTLSLAFTVWRFYNDGCSDRCEVISHCGFDLHLTNNGHILHSKLQQYLNWELPDVQAGFRKGGRTREEIANIYRIIQKARGFQENHLLLLHWLCLNLWLGRSQQTVEKFFKRWE